MANKKITKELIEKSIEIYGMGHPDVKTVFNIKDEIERTHPRFKSLVTISGRTLTAWFKYKEGEEEKQDKLPMIIPNSNDEQEIKEFILSSINNYLKK